MNFPSCFTLWACWRWVLSKTPKRCKRNTLVWGSGKWRVKLLLECPWGKHGLNSEEPGGICGQPLQFSLSVQGLFLFRNFSHWPWLIFECFIVPLPRVFLVRLFSVNPSRVGAHRNEPMLEMQDTMDHKMKLHHNDQLLSSALRSLAADAPKKGFIKQLDVHRLSQLLFMLPVRNIAQASVDKSVRLQLALNKKARSKLKKGEHHNGVSAYKHIKDVAKMSPLSCKRDPRRSSADQLNLTAFQIIKSWYMKFGHNGACRRNDITHFLRTNRWDLTQISACRQLTSVPSAKKYQNCALWWY